MAATLAARLSRFLVGCHPRRWRQRYADELLDVLEQHHAGTRTVLDLAFSTLDAHLDRASGVNALAFAPGRPILVSATGFDINGLDTVWDIADPARPRALARFEGGSPTAISPDGRTVATQSFHDQPTLWDVADPARPVHLATLGGHTAQIAAFAFGPGGRLLADVGLDGAVTVFDLAGRGGAVLTAKVHAVPGALGPADAPGNTDTTYTLAFSADGHTLTAIVASNSADPARAAATQTVSRWSLTAAGTAIPAGTVSRDSTPAGQLTVAPDGRFLARGAPPGGDAVSLSVLR